MTEYKRMTKRNADGTYSIFSNQFDEAIDKCNEQESKPLIEQLEGTQWLVDFLDKLVCASSNASLCCQKLGEIEDKIEQGLIIELPCKVGDTLYKVVNDKRVKHPYECKVIGIWISIREEDSNIHLAKYKNGVFEYSFAIPFSEIGKTVFLTKPEAEAKLKELQGAKQ